MDNELYLIHLDDYLSHVDGKLDMYDLLLELVRSVRKDLEAGEPSQAMRTLCGYEQQAHEMYEGWDIPDDYTAFCDINDLGPLSASCCLLMTRTMTAICPLPPASCVLWAS